MILYKGKVFEDFKQKELINTLKDDCYETISKAEKITPDDVIHACDVLAKKVRKGDFNHIIHPLLESLDIPIVQFEQYITMFEKEAIEKKCKIELGEDFKNLSDLDENNSRKIYPLGILFHIAAGNVDALPAYSVVEGLLAGNVNILKLPSGDNGLSIKLLFELIQIEPKIKEYIYVFDVPSTEVETLKIFANLADGIVVWGGDFAVDAARKMASVNTKIIAWGHKLSFAYATLDASDEDLIGLSHHICKTNQILCSSCQGIFLDSNSREELDRFANRVFNIFQDINKQYKPVSIGMRGKNSINIYNQKLEQHQNKKTIFNASGISVITSDDHELELSMLFRNIWVKNLPRDEIVKVLKPHKNHLQTVGLMTNKADQVFLSDKLAQAGIVRITKAEDMSRVLVGESHDGTYALREYTRIVETIK